MTINKSLWKSLSDKLKTTSGIDFSIHSVTSVTGGDINKSFCITNSDDQSLFVKLNQVSRLNLFTAEESGLKTITNTNTILCPKVIASGTIGQYAFLVLNHYNIYSRSKDFALGQQLAQMHQYTQTSFGFNNDNFIGSTPQTNKQHSNWTHFWIEERIAPQLELAYSNGFRKELKKIGKELLKAIPNLLADHQPDASLVHGDLWGGNKGFLEDNTPIIFDPACYYGDREVDIAMTRLFGGFSKDFYMGYDSIWPLSGNYKQRESLYNLYHQLNHLNLFGGNYLGVCQSTLKGLLFQ